MKSTSSQEQKGSVQQYVEQVFQKLHGCKSPDGVHKWVHSQQRKLLQEKLKHRVATERWKRSMKDLQVKQVSGGLQVPLMLTLMRQAGMSDTTVEFVRCVFTEGADYVGEVPLTGLYDLVPPDKEWGEYEYQEPPVLRKVYDVNKTVITSKHVRVPDKFTDKIYEFTQVEVDPMSEGALPFKTVVGPCLLFQELPADVVHPAFRFWVEQDVSSGAEEGRTVDDLTASGANYRTRIREKLSLPSLDDFVAMVKRVAEMSPESVWGDQMFFKHDMRKAFRQVPGSKQSRKWGAFAVKNPATGFIELFQHLSLPFGARAAPLIFCAVARIICELAAFHLGVPIVAFVDDFFATVPASVAQLLFDMFKWFVVEVLGFHFKVDKKEFAPAREGSY